MTESLTESLRRSTRGRGKDLRPRKPRTQPALLDSTVLKGPRRGKVVTDLGRRVKFARLVAGLSMREVEERSGVSNAYVCQIEGGLAKDVSIEVCGKLADVLGVGRGWLAGW